MNLATFLLKTGQTLIAWTEQLEAEPRVHLYRPHVISGKTKVTLSPWPEYTNDTHVLLTSDTLLTVCEPTEKVAEAYKAKVEAPESVEATEAVMLNEENDDDYEPRYVEEPLL